MVRDISCADLICRISSMEAKSLLSLQRPIVILKKRRTHGLSPLVSPKNRFFGVMLPYTPLHHLIMEGTFRALVMTSGNITEEPINIENETAFENLSGIADYYLTHDRGIYLRSDDSIVRIVDGSQRQVRRSRGYVPVPIFLPAALHEMPSILALGAELKNTLCLTKKGNAFISQHVGDMENLETFDFFRLTISHLRKILEITPQALAHDLHPDYLSTRYALEQREFPRNAVQHHHAHMVACLAENGVTDPALGVVLDGTGFGTDGQIWGGEILLGDLTSFNRAAHLEYVPLPGGDAAIKHPWRMALSHLYHTFGEAFLDLPLPFNRYLKTRDWDVVLQMIQKRINTPLTSSCGRFFDAVSSILGLRHTIAYEGQAAVELEMCIKEGESGRYATEIAERDNGLILKTSGIMEGIIRDLVDGLSRGVISARFHNTLIHMFTETCVTLKEEHGMERVALSGGAFQNATLLTGLTHSLSTRGFTVFSHKQVPSNDGGISLGQAVCVGLKESGMVGPFDGSDTWTFIGGSEGTG
jgi:hydrogenase maturation protein HypF